MPSRHPLIMTEIHPSTRFTIDGLLSLKLTINSRAAFRTSSPSSSLGSSFAFPASAGGKSNENAPSVGYGFEMVGVGPGSADGSKRDGTNESSAGRWGANRSGHVVNGVSVERNLAIWLWGTDGRVLSIGYIRYKDWACWCSSQLERYSTAAPKAANRT